MPRLLRLALLLATALSLGACALQPRTPAAPPADVRAHAARLLPAGVRDRGGWARDIEGALRALRLDPDAGNLCAVIAVIQQESGFQADPVVPQLGKIARAEIDRRAAAHHIPAWAVSAALKLSSPDGRSYAQRLAGARTERDLSRLYEDMLSELPLGQRLFADANPVRTAGPMQVNVAFAERFARDRGYPYASEDSIRHESFTRRGGVYFGAAHLLGYPADYSAMRYRFADFNAGWYASRNAAFQLAVSRLSGVALALDGDLLPEDEDRLGATEGAVRRLAARLDLSDAQIHRALADGDSEDFGQSRLYQRVFALADARGPAPRAVLPQIVLHSPKITRKLTTQWFAGQVEQRYEACLARDAAPRKAATSAKP
jgi:hypothetical protein